MRNLELVIFDMAGTTVDDNGFVARCFRDAIGAAGVQVSNTQVNEVMGWSKPAAIQQLLRSNAAPETDCEMATKVAMIHDDFVARLTSHYREGQGVREMPGCRNMMRQLRRNGIRVGINTGFNRQVAQVLIDRFGWETAGLVDGSVTSDEVERGRPAPDMIQHLMARFDIADPVRVAKVGDTPVDIDEGHAAGCGWVVAVTFGDHSAEALASCRPTCVVDSFEAMFRVFELDLNRGTEQQIEL